MSELQLWRKINELERVIDDLKRRELGAQWKWLTTPLTSTDWDGDAYSTTAKTLIDLSAVFSVPAGVKAVMVAGQIRDATSTGGDYYLLLSCNNTAGEYNVGINADRASNDRISRFGGQIVPCDTNGDIYYQIAASAASSMDIWLQIQGYCL